MMHIGLKLWSTNKNYIKEAVRLYRDGIFSYIELFSVPDSYKDNINLWRDLGIPYLIHAPHSLQGLNFSKKDQFSRNMELADEALLYADTLKAEYVIFHPGLSGTVEEAIRQINQISDSRIIVENKPFHAIGGDLCVGATFEEMSLIKKSCNVDLCLDFGHAICAANAFAASPIEYIKKMKSLKPKLYHLSDGDFSGTLDMHKNLGLGNFPLAEIVSLLPSNCRVTLETEKCSTNDLNDFREDVLYFNNLSKSKIPQTEKLRDI